MAAPPPSAAQTGALIPALDLQRFARGARSMRLFRTILTLAVFALPTFAADYSLELKPENTKVQFTLTDPNGKVSPVSGVRLLYGYRQGFWAGGRRCRERQQRQRRPRPQNARQRPRIQEISRSRLYTGS